MVKTSYLGRQDRPKPMICTRNLSVLNSALRALLWRGSCEQITTAQVGVDRAPESLAAPQIVYRGQLYLPRKGKLEPHTIGIRHPQDPV